MRINKKIFAYLMLLGIIAIVLYYTLITKTFGFDLKMFLFWAALSIVVESLLIPMPNNTLGVSVGYAINIAAIIVGGPLVATSASAFGVLMRMPKVPERGYIHLFNLPFYKTAFNVSQSIIVTSLMGIIYIATGGVIGQFTLLPVLLILLLGVVFNTFIISTFLSLSGAGKLSEVWASNLRGVFPSAVAVGTMGIIIALAFIGYGYGAVVLFFGPLLLARYSFKLYIEMRNLYISTIQALNKTIEAKDPYTSGHANRVEKFAVELAEAYKLPFKSIQNVKTAAILHDIGKIGIDDSILNKVEKLSIEEYQIIMTHPTIGADIISKVDFLNDVTNIVKHHHERYDGKGYPDGLSGEEIPLEACILMIADSYDAMTSDRPYRKALTNEVAIQELRKNAGTQFHPGLVEAFVKLLEKQV